MLVLQKLIARTFHSSTNWTTTVQSNALKKEPTIGGNP